MADKVVGDYSTMRLKRCRIKTRKINSDNSSTSKRFKVFKGSLLLAVAFLISLIPGIAFAQGSSQVNLTWDSIYGESYPTLSHIEITVKDQLGVVKATGDTTATALGDFLIDATNFSSMNNEPVNLRSGDEVTIIAEAGSETETDTISTNLNAFTSATQDRIYVRSIPNQLINLKIGYEGTTVSTSFQTDASGNHTYSSSSDILPNDYFTVYYDDENGNSIIANPIAPYGMVSIADDKVWGFYYQPDTTATVDIYSNGSKLASAVGKTDTDGDFSLMDFTPKVDIKQGFKVSIVTSLENNEFFANLSADVDFKTGKITGKTEPGSQVIARVAPSSGGEVIDKDTYAQTNGNYAVSANPGLKDGIWIASIHPDGNITQTQILFGTQSSTIGTPAVYPGDTNKEVGNIKIKEIRPQTLSDSTDANTVTLSIKTDGVTFAGKPTAFPTGFNLLHYNAELSEDSRTATWLVSDMSTNTAGSVILSQMRYSVDTDTAIGSVQIEVGGSSGVTTETLSNARVEPVKTTADLSGFVLDNVTGIGVGGARIVLMQNGAKISELRTASSGMYSFPAVKKGFYSLAVSRVGYTRSYADLDLNDNVVVKDFELIKTDIGVLTSSAPGTHVYEGIEPVLDDLECTISAISEDDFSSGAELKTNLSALFINSSDAEFGSADKQAIKDFVNTGGALYLSGSSHGLLSEIFPGKVAFPSGSEATVSTTQTIEASIDDVGLAAFMNSSENTPTLELAFNASPVAWIPIDIVGPTVDVYTSGDLNVNGDVKEDCPLAVGFNEGMGRVVYTSYYYSLNPEAINDDGGKLLTYLVSSSLMAGQINDAKDELENEGYVDFEIMVGNASSTDTARDYPSLLAKDKDLAAALVWRSGEFDLELAGPDTTTVEAVESTTMPQALIGKVAKAAEGEWRFAIIPQNLSEGKHIYALLIGAKESVQEPDGDQGGNPGDGTGDDSGDGQGNDNGNNGNGGNSSGGSGGSSSGGGSGGAAAASEIVDQTIPATPTGLKATQAKDGIQLKWNAVSSTNLAGYNVYRAARNDDEMTKLNKTLVVVPSFLDTSAEQGKLYYYLVTSISKAGKESEPSSFVASSLAAVLPDVAFKDVQAGAWYKEYLAKLVFADMIDGYRDGTFKPQNNITRAEFCKMLLSAVGMKPDTSTASTFNDTKGHWALSYIEAALELDIVGGYGNGSFRPDSNITRGEMAKMIVETKNMTVTKVPSGFTDCTGYWADPFISTLKSTKIISGYANNAFKPSDYATRAEACKVICLMLEG